MRKIYGRQLVYNFFYFQILLCRIIKFPKSQHSLNLIRVNNKINHRLIQFLVQNIKKIQSICSTTMTNTPTTIQIKSNDVLQLILQYLKENKFSRSFTTLQEQSGITLNQLNQKQFITHFRQQDWTYVMKQLSQLMLSQELFFSTYEYICDSLIQSSQFQAVSFLLQQVIKPNIKQMSLFKERIMRLQYITEHPDQKNLYKNPPTEQREDIIINQLLQVSTEAPSQRLLHLLTQSIKYQVAENVVNPSIKLNLFSGVQEELKVEPEAIIKQVEKTINYNEESKITALKLSCSEEYLAIGGIDGLIELYNTRDFSLYDNDYQREGEMFFHDFPIHEMQFNYSDQILASVDTKGIINLWNLKNGKLLRKIEKQSSVNAICWGVDPSHILVGYKDLIKLYGIRSCNVLKQYKCNHPEYISTIFVSQTNLYTISMNGTVSVFNYATAQLISTLQTKQNIVANFRLYNDNITWQFSKFCIGFKKKVVEYDQYCMETKQYMIEDGELQNCVGKDEYMYSCIKGSDSRYRISVMEKGKRKIVFYTGIESNLEHMLISRKRNLLITYDQKHKLSFWRPG